MLKVSPSFAYPLVAPHRGDPSAEAFRQRYPAQMAYLQERLRLPKAEEIFRVREERLAQRPRLDFGALTLPELRQRAANPNFAEITARVQYYATRFAGATPPATIIPDAHDPNRPFGDGLAWMAFSVLIDPDLMRRERTLSGLRRWLAAFRAWGPMTTNLSLAQSTVGQARVYDWLRDHLPPDELAAVRSQIVLQVRLSLDERMGGLMMWRGQRFAANHNWAQHSARAFAALALWGDHDEGELRSWLDDALVNFTIVRQTHSNDGAPMEGACYQDYGLRFYVDFCVLAETLLEVKDSFFDEEIRRLSNRIFTLLPNRQSSMVYADGVSTDWWGTCSQFRRLASHFQDGRFQLLADLQAACLDPRTRADWRSLLADDPALPAARLEDLPLFCDFPDFGLHTARSDWGVDAAFFGLRCGPASAESVTERFGYDFGEGHVLPNQGEFSFYLWGKPILLGCEYPKTKLTSNHSVVVFEGRAGQDGRLVGQLGEGGLWFNGAGPSDADRAYENRARTPRVVACEHTARYHHYLCELGGLYLLSDERALGGSFFPEYWRSLVFLADGAVAVVDRVHTAHARTCHFRLLTLLEDLAPDDGGFSFSLWGIPARIQDFSPVAFARSVATEHLPARVNADQMVATLRAESVTEATFAVVIGVGAAGGYRLKTDALGYELLDLSGRRLLRVDWPENS